jgi:dUTP pyrophosphatase
MIELKLIYNFSTNKFKDLLLYDINSNDKLINIKVKIYNEDVAKDKKSILSIKASSGARTTPFCGIYTNGVIIKGFYSENNGCNKDEIINYLLNLYKTMIVEILKKDELIIPKYANPGDSGCDVYAELNTINEKFMFDAEISGKTKTDITSITISPGGRALIPTNIFVAIPENYEIQVRPRSGLALKQGITVLNTPGTIDSGYRNEIGVILLNTSNKDVVINDGDRIAQLVLMKVEKIEWKEVNKLSDTDRGLGGFGSSGK